MKNTVYELNTAVALTAAAKAVGAELSEITNETVTLVDGYYEVTFDTEWVRYDCYVDAVTGEVPGIMTEPVPFEDYEQTMTAPECKAA
jgi:hypothetical protein